MIRFLLAVITLCLSSALVRAAPPIQHWVTASGAKVFFVETHVLPMVDLQVTFSAGSAYDPASKSGLAGLTHALLDAGAGGLDEEQITARIADNGAALGGVLDLDRAGVSLRSLSSATELNATLGIVSKILQAPAFESSILDREKARTVASIKDADTRPDAIADKRFAATLYPHHPYGVRATVASVSSITRRDLLAFYQRHYGARRAVLSIVGDLTRAQAEGVAEQLTAGLPKPPADDRAEPTLPEVQQPKAQTVTVPHPAAQSHILLGMPGIRRGDPDHFPLLVGNYILGGGGFVSRLTREVREKRGFAYSIHSYFSPLRQPGPFQIGLMTKRSQTAEALKVVRETLNQFLQEGPGEAELADAKRNLSGGFALRLDSNRKMLEYLDLIGFYNLPLDYLDTFQAKIEAVSTEQIKEAFSRRIQPDQLSVVVVAGE